MRSAVLILMFFTSKLLAQVGPPDLRCLEVLYPGGQVKLTWIPASDTANKFSFYEVFTSISPNGPYSLVSPTIGPVSTSTFVHASATASAQSRYYFVRTRFNNAADSSRNSDTLRSMFLNVIAGITDLKLSYNNVHMPRLPSAASTFTITKEYPPGTISNLAILSPTVFSEVIDICHVKLNYQVSLYDNSGCTSVSNLIVGEYEDTKAPDSTVVDSISVLDNGYTVLAWQIPYDKDIVKYKIIENLVPGQQNFYIDSADGRTSTSYTYKSLAATKNSLGLYVSAQDSCRKIGNFDDTPRTMYLVPIYDQCGYRTFLRWTRYRGLKGGVKEYRIYYSVNGGAFERVGATSDSTFLHSGTAPAQNVCYFIRVVNGPETITASSNRVCFFTKQVTTPAFLYLQSADVIASNSVQVRLHVDNSVPMTGIDILRSEDSLTFLHAGFVPFNGSTSYIFNDADAQPGTRSYYYRAQFRDSCGNMRALSNTARTIYLKINADADNIFSRHLSWNAYRGFSGDVSGYAIYRYVNDVPPVGVHATTGPEVTSYTDNLEDAATQGARVDYVVHAVEGIGNLYGILERSNSNMVSVYMEGNIFIPNAFSPAGVNAVWKPVTHFVDRYDYHVRVFNRWGKMVFQSSDPNEGWDGANCLPGIYAYLINYKNSRGEYMERTGSVSLIR